MRIQHNDAANFAKDKIKENEEKLNGVLEQINSGLRLARSKNDAAGSSISQKMKSQIRGLAQASENAQDGISLLDTADGAAGEIQEMLNRMRELAVESANDVNNVDDRHDIKEEIDMLSDEINRIASDTEYNTMKLIDGTLEHTGKPLDLQVGANANQKIVISIQSLLADTLGITNLDVSDTAHAGDSISVIDDASSTVSAVRSRMGAMRNRIQYAINNNDNEAENVQTAESRIADADIAKLMVQYSKLSIVESASISMLTQANSYPRDILALIGGNEGDDSGYQDSSSTNTNAAS